VLKSVGEGKHMKRAKNRGNELLPEGLPIRVVAEQLHVHPETIRRGIRAGEIPVVKLTVGYRRGVIRIPRAWLEDRMTGATA
jgi:hypothetical protein